jgi:hypothetical protein
MYSGGLAGKPATITYGELAKRMGYPSALAGHTLGRPLGLVGKACLQAGLPPLNVIVVSKETGQPGAEVILRPGSSVETDQAAVMQEDWYQWHTPSAAMFRAIWENRLDELQEVGDDLREFIVNREVDAAIELSNGRIILRPGSSSKSFEIIRVAANQFQMKENMGNLCGGFQVRVTEPARYSGNESPTTRDDVLATSIAWLKEFIQENDIA